MPSPEAKMSELLDYLDRKGDEGDIVEKRGAHGARVISRNLSPGILAVDDHGPNGARVIDVSHQYDGTDPVIVVRVGWV